MSENIKKVALFVRDLLVYDEQLIRLGHYNYTRSNFDTAMIAIDKLGGSENLSNGKYFDADEEELTPYAQDQDLISIRFYGSGAYDRANNFRLMTRTQASLELQQNLGITVYNPTGLIDINQMTGKQYGKCYEINMKVSFNIEITIDTLRFDTENISFLSNK